MVGVYAIVGRGGATKSTEVGFALLAEAAGRGSAVACVTLGNAFASGRWNAPKDEHMARRWFSKVAHATIKDDSAREIAAQWLREHPA